MTGLSADAIARSAELERKQALATERATMIEALEKIKPQLERIAVEPAEAEEEAEAVPAPLAETDAVVICRACGHELEQEESYCGLFGAPRPSHDQGSGDLQSKWASLWHLKQAADIRKSEAAEALESKEAADSGVVAVSKKEEVLALEPVVVEAETEDPTTAPWTSASQTRRWFDSFSTPPRRVWLAKHRANLYLITAAVLLFAVI